MSTLSRGETGWNRGDKSPLDDMPGIQGAKTWNGSRASPEGPADLHKESSRVTQGAREEYLSNPSLGL